MVGVRYGRDKVWKGMVGVDYGRVWQGKCGRGKVWWVW